MLKLGVLGGIGVEATGYFYLSLIKRLQASGSIHCNQDYPQIFINSVPAPELHLEEHDRPDIVAPYIKGVEDLKKMQPDVMVMVCNTIHLYLQQIKTETGFNNFIDIPQVVREKIVALKPKSVCVMGTGLTVTRGLYRFPDINYIDLTHQEQEQLCEVVVAFNNGETSEEALQHHKKRLLDIARSKQDQGVDLFVLACTEISEILSKESLPILDTLEILIDATAQRCLSIKK